MKTILTILALFAASFDFASAGTGESTRATAAGLQARMEYQGYEVRSTYTHGNLSHGQCSREFTTLYAGVSYIIAVEGAVGATDVDVWVYDGNGNLIGSDTDGTNVGLVTLTPRWTGSFRIVVKMADTAYGDGSFVIQTGSL